MVCETKSVVGEKHGAGRAGDVCHSSGYRIVRSIDERHRGAVDGRRIHWFAESRKESGTNSDAAGTASRHGQFTEGGAVELLGTNTTSTQ